MKRLSYLSPKAAVKASPIHGNGLFAIEAILAGEIVCVKGGHIFLRDELQGVSAQLGPAEIQIGRNLFIGPLSQESREGSMIFSNHSCDPNIGVKGQIVFVAMRDIKAGEELTHDWAMTDNDTYEMQCHCNAPNCRKVITGQDWRKPELQERYRGFMSWYLTEQSRNEIVTKRLLLRQWRSTDRERCCVDQHNNLFFGCGIEKIARHNAIRYSLTLIRVKLRAQRVFRDVRRLVERITGGGSNQLITCLFRNEHRSRFVELLNYATHDSRGCRPSPNIYARKANTETFLS